MTARPGEAYDACIDRILPNPLARCVKIADVTDNLDIWRLGDELTDRDVERIRKYERALARLTGS